MSCQRVLPDALGGDVVVSEQHVHLEPLPRVVAEARRFVREHAPALAQESRDVLLLLTSELVTNAVLHAGTEIELGLTVGERSVLVTVHDLDLAFPRPRPEAREGGWGLALVAALAEASALQVHPDDGKTAWFRIPRDGVARVEDEAAARREPGSGP